VFRHHTLYPNLIGFWQMNSVLLLLKNVWPWLFFFVFMQNVWTGLKLSIQFYPVFPKIGVFSTSNGRVNLWSLVKLITYTHWSRVYINRVYNVHIFILYLIRYYNINICLWNNNNILAQKYIGNNKLITDIKLQQCL